MSESFEVGEKWVFVPSVDEEHTTTIYTFGHAARSIDEFVATLKNNRVELVADVRRYPNSRSNPQFGCDEMTEQLNERGLEYRHLGSLGGRRSEQLLNSPNRAWQNESFRCYADYALSSDFQRGLAKLETLSERASTVVVCAETVFWRCHRRIIADWLVARGHHVSHIFGGSRVREHEMTGFAEVDEDGVVTYPTAAYRQQTRLEANP